MTQNSLSLSKYQYNPPCANRIKKIAERKRALKQRSIFDDVKSCTLHYWILSALNLCLKKARSDVASFKTTVSEIASRLFPGYQFQAIELIVSHFPVISALGQFVTSRTGC